MHVTKNPCWKRVWWLEVWIRLHLHGTSLYCIHMEWWWSMLKDITLSCPDALVIAAIDRHIHNSLSGYYSITVKEIFFRWSTSSSARWFRICVYTSTKSCVQILGQDTRTWWYLASTQNCSNKMCCASWLVAPRRRRFLTRNHNHHPWTILYRRKRRSTS